MAETDGGLLAADWESCTKIRNRFRKEISWLQWPVVPEVATEGGEEEKDRHPICTKSLELNVEAIDLMLDFYHGGFIDIHQLQKEACPGFLPLV